VTDRRVGPCAIEEEVSRRAGCVVLRGRHPSRGPVGVLLLTGARGATPAERRRWREEDLSPLIGPGHANCLRLDEAGDDEGLPFVVTEDAWPAETLQERLDDEGPLPIREAAVIALRLARALESLHWRGVLHRDVRPANVLVGRADGEPVLAGYGVLRDLETSLARSGRRVEGRYMGTPGYWPPEQARGDLAAIGTASDVYALGATLYALLVGRPPFPGSSVLSRATLEVEPDPPSAARPEVDADLEEVVLRALEKEPAQRYRTASEMARALTRWLATPAEERRPTRSSGRAARPPPAASSEEAPAAPPASEREGNLVLAVVAAALVLAAGVWLWTDLQGRRDDRLRAQFLTRARAEDPRTVLAMARDLPERVRSEPAVERVIAAARAGRTEDPLRALTEARVAARDGDWERARTRLDAALAADPSLAAAYAERADAALELGDPEAALVDAERAIELGRPTAANLTRRAEARLLRDDRAGAREDVARALRLDAHDPRAQALDAHLRDAPRDWDLREERARLERLEARAGR